MQEKDRTRIFQALLGEPDKLAKMDPDARRVLEEVATQELNAIEPIIDEMLTDIYFLVHNS